MRGFLERRFHLAEHGTTPRTEVLAGVTTFLTLAYILFVQPALLSSVGLDFGAVFVATCLASAFATLLMAWSRGPRRNARTCRQAFERRTIPAWLRL